MTGSCKGEGESYRIRRRINQRIMEGELTKKLGERQRKMTEFFLKRIRSRVYN